MNVVLFGATGMVGAGALLECLADPRVGSVVAIGRSPTGRVHPKLREVIQTDLFMKPLQADVTLAYARATPLNSKCHRRRLNRRRS